MEDMIGSVIGKSIDIISKSLELKKDIRNISSSFEAYLVHQYRKFKFNKDIIDRTSPSQFSKTYVPLTISTNSYRTYFEDPQVEFEKYPHIILSGVAGSGKSTFSKYIYLQCLELNYKFPVFIELWRYSRTTHTSFVGFLLSEIGVNRDEDAISSLSEIFVKGGFVFILDGYEEISPQEKSLTTQQIEEFIDNYSHNKFLITTRPGTNIEYLPTFYEFSIDSLNTTDIINFIRKRVSKEVADRVIQRVDLKDNSSLTEFLSNPLFLSIFLIQFKSLDYDNIDVSTFYRTTFDYLFSQHDAISKLGYVRNKLSGLSRDDLEYVISRLAFVMMINQEVQMSKDRMDIILNKIKIDHIKFDNVKLVYDLEVSLNLITESKGYYSFWHVSLMEYFACKFISGLDHNSKIEVYNKLEQKALKSHYAYNENVVSILYSIDRKFFMKNFAYDRIAELISKPENDRLQYLNSILCTSTTNSADNETFLMNKLILGLPIFKDKLLAINYFCNYNDENFMKNSGEKSEDPIYEIAVFLDKNYKFTNDVEDSIIDLIL